MKLSRRLGLIVGSAILGLIVVAGVALITLRATMLDELRTVLILAAAASLREISAGAEATVAKVRDVASATAEQSQAGTCVAQHVERIARMAEESAASVRAADEDVKRLETLASELRESVARFRL
ncbi:hypothetical protein [Zoogloea sp. LCSB751]|uniref:hypothetical protein n=1 Tax=Zoogloea sp. LCSB751 TaxID=1965277 RepID=UPI0009A4C11A|nr:hypothetical protein [Zoogloea sp. LCSB751]